MRVHADGSGIEDGVKGLRAQSTARDDFATDSAGQFARCIFTARADVNAGTRTRESEGSGTSGSASAEDQYAAFRERQFFLQRAQDADVIRIAAVERTIAAHHDCIHRAYVRGQRVTILQVPQ